MLEASSLFRFGLRSEHFFRALEVAEMPGSFEAGEALHVFWGRHHDVASQHVGLLVPVPVRFG